MDKATFLVQLQKNIGMLDDDEQKDIIDEYSQHIDMKVSGGMTEAEAIEDFGDFNEFVREVLNAYHVKAPFDQEDAVEAAATASPTAGDRLDDAVRGGAQAAGRAVDATKRGARKMASVVTGAAGKFSDRAKEAVSQASAARAEARAEAAASGVEADRDGSESRAAAASGTSRGMIAEVGGMARSFSGVCWNVAKTAARWCWNFAVACLMASGGFMALVSLFCLGLGVVFLVQGYPVAGLTIAAAGCSMAFAAISFLLSRLIMRKHADDAMACKAAASDASGLSSSSSGPSSTDGRAAIGSVGSGGDASTQGRDSVQGVRPGSGRDTGGSGTTAPLAFSGFRGEEARVRGAVMRTGFDPRGFDGGRFSTAPMGAVSQVRGKGAFYE